MLKKPLLTCLLTVATLTGATFCSLSYAVNSVPPSQSDKTMPEDASSASSSASAPATFDRGGVDRASVHLQIFQQSNSHFSDSNLNKKAGTYDKKAQAKSGRDAS